MKTLPDPEVARRLSKDYVLALHNQLPELYCNNTVDPGVDNYPGDMVDRCPEGAGGGNIRTYVCTPDGRVLHLTLGYWRKERFLVELDHADEVFGRRNDPGKAVLSHERFNRNHQLRRTGSPLAQAQENMFIRSHREAIDDLGKPIAEVLGRIEDEIYLLGRIG